MIVYEIEVNNKVKWRKLALDDSDFYREKAIAQTQLMKFWYSDEEVKLMATILEVKSKGEIPCTTL